MQLQSPAGPTLHDENIELRARLADMEEMLHAIRHGEVDALIIESVVGPQLYTLQGLDAETNRFRGEILAQVSDAVICVGDDERIIYLNAAAERLYGVVGSEALGKRLVRIYELQWLRPDDSAKSETALRDCGEWRGENIHILRDGRKLNVESSITVLTEIAGQPAGRLAVIRDITRRKQHEDKVLISEIRYRRLFEAAHDGILLLNPVTRKIVDANPFMTNMLGYAHDRLIGKELFEIGLLEDEGASRRMFRKLQRAGQVRYENLPLQSEGGQQYDVDVVANRYDENGRYVIQCNIRDISDRRRSEEHVNSLMAEVNHRAKNLLAVVQALTQQTAKYGEPETFTTRLSQRIGGLAVGQDLLVKSQWLGVEISELVEAQLAHFKDLVGTRILFNGPAARLTAGAAQGIGMALHELATNAAKYGALSNAEGSVRIAWQVATGVESTFFMSWLEECGPRVVMHGRKGFGHTVIGRMAEAAVQGIAEIRFDEAGLSWNLSAPLQNVIEPTRGAKR